MPRIAPVPWEELDPEARELIEVAQACRAVHETPPWRAWALRPEQAKAQLPIQTRYYDNSNILDGRLLELVQLRIAALNDCRARTD